MKLYIGVSRAEMSYFTNLIGLVVMTIFLLITGDLQEALSFTFLNYKNFVIMICYTILSYVAISFHMTLVKEFGGIAAVIVGKYINLILYIVIIM